MSGSSVKLFGPASAQTRPALRSRESGAPHPGSSGEADKSALASLAFLPPPPPPQEGALCLLSEIQSKVTAKSRITRCHIVSGIQFLSAPSQHHFHFRSNPTSFFRNTLIAGEIPPFYVLGSGSRNDHFNREIVSRLSGIPWIGAGEKRKRRGREDSIEC